MLSTLTLPHPECSPLNLEVHWRTGDQLLCVLHFFMYWHGGAKQHGLLHLNLAVNLEACITCRRIW